VTEHIPKKYIAVALSLGVAFLLLQAYRRPGYFTNDTYMAALVLLELLAAALFFFRKVFFPITLISFLFAGLNVSVGSGWTTARWIFLGVGAAAGIAIALKEHIYVLNRFHAFAMFSGMAALISAAVSPYPSVAMLKALSLFLLFAYAGSGVRFAVMGRESRFFTGLVWGCEIFVVAVFGLHLIGTEAMGNPNSLGAAMGVAMAPVLMWAALLPLKGFDRQRHIASCVICIYLVFLSHSRAGMAAAGFAFALLTVGLRRYKLLITGFTCAACVLVMLVIVKPDYFSDKISSLTNEMVYKGSSADQGIFLSRQSPWKAAVESISKHFWFGTGFGTTDTGKDASEHFAPFASNFEGTSEHGSSYLAIVSWVGIVGVVPFALLTVSIVSRAFRTLLWMSRTRNPLHPAIPLAIVVLSGLLHAGFEDWLFAPGYYLCVFFWSMAFILVDVVPLPHSELPWRVVPSVQARQPWQVATEGRPS
jgi:hypothetical protein